MFIPATILELLNGVRALGVAVLDADGNQLSGFDSSRPANATLTQPTVTNTSSVILASNVARRQAIIVNDAGSKIFVAFAATASSTAFTVELPNNQVFSTPLNGYTGAISAIKPSGSGTVRVTEVTS